MFIPEPHGGAGFRRASGGGSALPSSGPKLRVVTPSLSANRTETVPASAPPAASGPSDGHLADQLVRRELLVRLVALLGLVEEQELVRGDLPDLPSDAVAVVELPAAE